MVNELKKLSLFQEVSPNVLKDLIIKNQIIKKEYSKGTTIHEQNKKCISADVIFSGKLITYSLSPNGSESIISQFESGNIVGANLLFGKRNHYPMNIYCVDDSTVFHITKLGISQLLREYSFVMEFIESLSLNAQGMNQKIAMYTQKTLRENLIDYLSALALQQKSSTIILPTTKKELADYFGVQRPSLFRELKRMKDEGIIRVNNREITLEFSPIFPTIN